MGARPAANQLNVQYVIDPSGERTVVLLPLAEFEELMEDLEDLAALAERHDEPTTSHEEFVAELKQDGLL
jgi:PHD/YefM family antitoxin component YafN of YafNO toxin-antitoxin module